MHKQKVLMSTDTQIMCHMWNNLSLYFTHSLISFRSPHKFKMEKFVTITKKSKIDDENRAPENSNLNDNSGQSSNLQESEKPKRKLAVRKFNLEWENDFFVTEHNGKTICLQCRMEFSDNKKSNIERHFKTQHGDKNEKFLDPSKRKIEIARLKNAIDAEKKVVRKFLDKNEILTSASYQIAFNIAKAAKPYTDGEFHKSLLKSTISTLCTNFDEKMKINLLENVQQLPLSGQTISRRIHDLGTQIETKLKDDLQRCHSFAVALDETTDISDISQLVFWVRFVIDVNTIKEELLALVPLKEQTRAIDIFDAFLSIITRFNLDLNKLVCICTDGAPAMIGKKSGFVANVQKYMRQKGIQHNIISYHCILHQENLCAKAIQRGCDVLKTVTEVHLIFLVLFITLIVLNSYRVCLYFSSDYQ